MLASAAEQRMKDFNSQELANTAWAFATVGHKDEWLFSMLAAAAEQRMKDFHLQELTSTAWAFAKVGHKDEPLFSTLTAVSCCRAAHEVVQFAGAHKHSM